MGSRLSQNGTEEEKGEFERTAKGKALMSAGSWAPERPVCEEGRDPERPLSVAWEALPVGGPTEKVECGIASPGSTNTATAGRWLCPEEIGHRDGRKI